jgi:hypothetical protein
MNYHLTLESGNQKTGPIPVSTTERSSCPPTCPFFDKGCYAKGGPLGIHWSQVSKQKRGGNLGAFTEQIRNLPQGQLWRHNQAGDLPGKGVNIARGALNRIVEANVGKRGFTYSHKPVTKHKRAAENREAIREANARGFTVNLSGNNPAHADELVALGVGPVVSVVPEGTPNKFVTPAGNRGVICPAQQRDDVTCAKCGLCSHANRKIIVGFLPHGQSKNAVNAIAKENK